MTPAIKTRKLGEILLNHNLITKEQLAKAIEEQKKSRQTVHNRSSGLSSNPKRVG